MGILKKHPAIFLGALITVVFLALSALWNFNFFELKFYDIMMNSRTEPEAVSDIIVVDIDDESIDKIGRWPWERIELARGIDVIRKGNPNTIGLNVILSDPQTSSAMRELEYIEKTLSRIVSEKQGSGSDILKMMEEARLRLDNDTKLAQSIDAAGNVVLPVFFKMSKIRSSKTTTPNPLLKQNAIPSQNVINPEGRALPGADEIKTPIDMFFKAAEGIGHVNISYDSDGKVRRNLLTYQYKGTYIPSFSLRLASAYMGISAEGIQINVGESVTMGDIQLPVTDIGAFYVNFKGPAQTFTRYSFFDVVNGKIPPENFQGKIVLITPSATGIQNPISVPTANAMSVGEFTANSVWSILNQKTVVKPSWNGIVRIVLILVVGALISLVFPRLKAMWGGVAFLVLTVLFLGVSYYFFVSNSLWIQVTLPVVQLIIGYIGAVTLSYFVTETKKEKVETESAETNRMLGLSFQGQGMLDMAFDKFRKVPVDDEMKGILYTLALDYERKRQFNKAANVYEYIENHDSSYRDVSNKKAQLMQASETMVYGDGLMGGGGSNDPLLATSTGTRPTLGRYEVLKQLGKGAMGVVYLGQDPRINRTCAIKTFRFSDDLEPDEMESLKKKFFREAESAGTLNHPNIVTIYDAGDEQDLAYIAMEYLEGEDLQKFTKKKNLLPMRKVLAFLANIADGLDYAHAKGIVHRDVKPANIMILKSGVIKITDFGIARITATSQTQTGVVKGTPHYMSPEQISGEKVDGRSDIFSLGVMMYQMLTGTLPFTGDSPAALMHQIMNVRHPDPRQRNPKLLKAHVTIIDKALEKDRDKRYQKASEMAAHLKALGKKIDALIAKKKGTSGKSGAEKQVTG